MTSEPFSPPNEAFVWVWLPGATTPVVAGRIERDVDVGVFGDHS